MTPLPLIRVSSMAIAGLLLTACVSTKPRPPGTVVSVEDGDVDQEQVLEVRNRDAAAALAHFSRSISSDQQGHAAEAIDHLLQAVEADPDNDRYYFEAAERLSRSGRRVEAVDLILQLAERQPENARPQVFLGILYQRNAETAAAVAAYRRATELAPEDLALLKSLTDLLVAEGRIDEAATLLREHLPGSNNPEAAWALLGKVLLDAADAADEGPRKVKLRDDALAVFRAAAKAFPQQRLFALQTAALLLQRGDIEEALDAYAALEGLLPDSPAVKRQIADALAKELGGDQPGVEQLTALMADRPNDGLTPFYIGHLLEKLNQSEEAVEWYAKAIERLPGETSAVWRQAAILADEDLAAGLTLLEEARKLHPDSVRLLESQAYLLSETNRYEEALQLYAEAEALFENKDLESTTGRFHVLYARSALALERYASAEIQLRKATEVNPALLSEFIQSMFPLFDELEETDEAAEQRLRKALPMASRVVSDHANDPFARIYLGLLYSFIKDYPEAVALYNQAERITQRLPNGDQVLTARFFFSWAAATERTGDLARAEELFRFCIEKDPQHAEAYNYMAYMWAENNMRLREAKDLIDQALKLEPGNGAYLDTKGWILFQQGRYEEALPLLEEALNTLKEEFDTDDPAVLDHLGDTHHRLGNLEKAVDFYQRALVAEPEKPDAVREKLTALRKELEDRAPSRPEGEEEESDGETEPDVEPGPDTEPDAESDTDTDTDVEPASPPVEPEEAAEPIPQS